MELAKAYIRVQADSSTLKTDLDGIRHDTESRLAGVRQSALAVLGIFTGGLSSILRSGMASAGQFEQTTIAFETMLGSAKETQEVLNNLTIFAAKTPFEMPEITQAARGLIQFGERGEELMETLNLLGNAAAGSSTPFSFLALVFNQVRGVGKLLTQDFRQLSTRGILSMQDIADHFGVSLQKAEEKISKGGVKFEDLRKILKKLSGEGGRFNNLMQKQSQSLVGLTSTLNDAWSILFRVLATGLTSSTKAFTAMMIKVAETIQTVVTYTDGLAGSALAGSVAISGLGAALLGAGLAAKFFGITLQGALIGTGIGVALVLIGAALGVIVDKFDLLGKGSEMLGGLLDSMSQFAINTWDWLMAIYNNWQGIWAELPEMVRFAFSYLGDIISNAGPLLAQSIGYGLGQMLNAVKSFAEVFMNMWQTLMTRLSFFLMRAFMNMNFREWILKAAKGELTLQDFIPTQALAGVASDAIGAVGDMVDSYQKGVMGAAPEWENLFNMSDATKAIKDGIGVFKKIEYDAKFGKQAPDAGKKTAEVAAKPTTPAEFLKQGRYQIPDLANKLQDKLLEGKDKDALDKSRNSMLEAGLAKQDELIRLQKENMGKTAAALTGGDS